MNVQLRRRADARAMLKSSASWSWLRLSSVGLLAALPVLTPMAAQANPAGGTVTSGSATIAKPATGQTKITQTSEGVVIDWSSFNIGSSQTTTFVQPNAQAIAVNRIGSNAPTQILGNLDANGRVVLINGNGLLFGKNSKVNVGSLVATSTDGSDSDILSGKASFTKAGSASASIVNRGVITAAPNGLVALVAPTVTNRGTINAKLGSVNLGAANKFTLDLSGDGLVSFAAQGDVNGNAKVTNLGNITGANVTLTARAAEGLATGVVNTGGTIEASGAHGQGGNITLDTGNGGDVAINGSLKAAGSKGGGTIAIGYSGASTSPATLANKVTVSKTSMLNADATQNGTGGTIHVLSQGNTIFQGHVSAKGGALSGDGGLAEISSHGIDSYTGHVDTTAANGATGDLLLDPENVTIEAMTTSGGSLTGGTFTPSADNSILSVTDLQAALAHSNVTVATGGAGSTGSQTGDITIASALGWSNTDRLTLDAYHSVNVTAPVTISGAGRLTVVTNDGGTGGVFGISNGSNIAFTNGGALSINSHVYTLETSVASLAAGIAAKPTGYFALANNYDATADGTYTSAPIATDFTGTFEGLGNTISNLTINAPTVENVGLFAEIDLTGVVRDLNINGGSVTGGDSVGALVGYNNGLVSNSSASTSVTGLDFTNDDNNGYAVGGLVGFNQGIVDKSHDSGIVTGYAQVGGLVGGSFSDATHSASITNSYATGAVFETGGTDAGGLVGQTGTQDGAQSATVNNDYATGNVTGTGYDGGFTGDINDGLTTNSYATGNVIIAGNSSPTTEGNGSYAGGFAGYIGNTYGPTTLNNVYATGTVSGNYAIGGLIGRLKAGDVLSNSYATGAVSGTQSAVGGLVGQNYGSISSSYALGSVTSLTGSITGGLVGLNDGSVTQSFATNNVSGFEYVGGLAGYNYAGSTITQSYATGSVTVGADGGGGGFVGENDGTITQSWAREAVSSSNNATTGGFVGYNMGDIEQSYSLGTILGSTNSILGGFAGNNNGTLNASYTASAAAAGSGTDVGGVVGSNSGTVTNTYFDSQNDTAGVLGIAGGSSGSAAGLTTSQLEKASKLPGLTFGTLGSGANWVIVDIDGTFNNAGGAVGETMPMLLSEYSTSITNDHQLQLMDLNLSANYSLANFIEANGTGNGSDVWGSKGFVPVGTLGNTFTGIFNGSGLSIDSLMINQTNNYTGLFGYINGGATITGVGLTNAKISGAADTGALAGESDGLIQFSYAAGTVSATGNSTGGVAGDNEGTINYTNAYDSVSSTGINVGGLVGSSGQGLIENSNATGKVKGTGEVGGLVGTMTQGTLTDDIATGVVTNSGNITGGLVGQAANVTIDQSYATGAVNGSGIGDGGLVGNLMGGTITNSFATGGVSGTSYVGGLVGAAQGTIQNSDALGTVTGVNDVGGLAGVLTSGSVSNSYSTGSVTGTGSGASSTAFDYFGGLVGGADANSSVTNSYSSSSVNTSGAEFDMAGGLIGGNSALVSNSYATGSVTMNDFVGIGGGLVGGNAGTISNSYATGAVSVTGQYGEAGGLVGGNSGTVQTSYATSPVTVTGDNAQAGGVVGGNSSVVTQDYSQALVTVNGNSAQAGGVVGGNSGSISKSYSMGAVSVTGTGAQAGGVAGGNSGPIDQTYALAPVILTGSGQTGGIVGGNSSTVTNSFFDTQTGNQTLGDGANAADSGTQGVTTAQLQASLSSLNFDSSVWSILPGQSFPYLNWQFSGTPQVVSGQVLTDFSGTGVQGAAVRLIVDGVQDGTIASYANGFYYFLLAPGSIPSTNGQVLVGNNGGEGITFADNADGTVTGLNIIGNYLADVIGAANYSTVVADLATAVGTVPNVQSTINALPNLAIVETGATLNVNQSITTGTLVLSGGATVTQSAPISAASLVMIDPNGTFALTNSANAIGQIDGMVSNLTLTDSTGLTIGTIEGINGLTSSGNASLTTTSGNIAINSQLDATGAASKVTLNSAGTIKQGAAGILTAVTLTGNSVGGTTLTDANQIGTLNGFSNTVSGNVAITDASALRLLGAINAGVGNLTIAAGGLVTISGTLTTPKTLTLTTTGGISEGSAGSINASILTGSSGAGANLSATNTITTLDAFSNSGGTFTLDDTSALKVGAEVDGGLGDNLALVSSGALTIDAVVSSGNKVTLTSGGAISENSSGDIDTTSLTGSAVGNVALTGPNQFGTLLAFTAGSTLSLNDVQSLTLRGVLSDTGSVTLSDIGVISEGTGGSISTGTLTANSPGGLVLNGPNLIATLSASSVSNAGLFSLTDDESLKTMGTISAGTAGLTLTTANAGSNIAIDGIISTAGTATLNSAGTIGENSAGSLQVGTLAGSGGGAIALAGSNNMIGTLSNMTDTAGAITLTDGETLSIAGAVNNGSNKLTVETLNGDIDISGAIQATSVVLTSDQGQIAEPSSTVGAIDTTNLYVTANTGIDLIGPNVITKVKTNHTNTGPDVINGAP